jgi:hypothetical protein
MEHSFFSSKFEEKIINLMYKNYWIDSLTSNFILGNNDNYNEKITKLAENLNEYNLK